MVSPSSLKDPPRTPAFSNPHCRNAWQSRTKGRLLGAFFAIIVAGFALCKASVALAAFDYRDTTWEGCSELLALARERLGTRRVRLVAKLDYAELKPSDAVLVLHPDLELEYEQVSAFLAAGGRLAVLDDFGAADRLLAHYRIFRVQAPVRPAAALRDNPALAIAIPSVQAVAGQEQNRHPIVANVERIITNHPSALTNPNLTPVLTIPALGEPDAVLALTGVIAGKGRLFAMADASAVINLMLRYPGNRAFADGLVEYLVEDDTWGSRGGALYVLANRFDQAGHFGKAEDLRSGLSQLTTSVTDTITTWHREGLPSELALVLAAMGAAGALVWVASHSLRRYRPTLPRHASPVPLLAQGGLPGRAAVLSASSTDLALVVAEMYSLLREELATRAGLPSSATAEASMEVLRERGATTPHTLARLSELLRLGRRAQDAILHRRPSRFQPGQVADYERRLNQLLLDLDRPAA